MILLLIFIAYRVVYHKYGYQSLEDQKLLNELGIGDNRVIDCRSALIYYAERELMIINKTRSREIADKYNITLLASYFNSSNQQF